MADDEGHQQPEPTAEIPLIRTSIPIKPIEKPSIKPCPPCSQPTALQKEITATLFKVPDGFQALLKHMARELLAAKPKDPYVYIADYLKTKLSDKKRGMLEKEFFDDDTLNIDIKHPMDYLRKTSLENVSCPSTTAFNTLANEAALTLQSTFRGVRGRHEAAELRRDPERGLESKVTHNRANRRSCAIPREGICARITPSILEECGFSRNPEVGRTSQVRGAERNSVEQPRRSSVGQSKRSSVGRQ